METTKTITTEAVLAYSQCQRKAFLLLHGDDPGLVHDYERLVTRRRDANRHLRLNQLNSQYNHVEQHSQVSTGACGPLVQATLTAGNFQAYCDILTKLPEPTGPPSYQPSIITGQYTIANEHKLTLLYIGYLLGQLYNKSPSFGCIIDLGGHPHRARLDQGYHLIVEAFDGQFSMKISSGTIANFMRYFGEYYSGAEEILLSCILRSPFIHADETKVNIQGSDRYVWVFCDDKHAVFKMTDTREADIARSPLAGYTGVVVSDFYAGYDSLECRQQKCLVHLIRDLNEDLRKAPLDGEFEAFVLEVRDLIVPILQAGDKFGLKARHLKRYALLWWMTSTSELSPIGSTGRSSA